MANIDKIKVAKMINFQKKIIANPKIDKNFRAILNENLKFISVMYDTIQEYEQAGTIKAIQDLYKSRSSQDDDELVAILDQVREYLGKDNSDIYGKVNIKENEEEVRILIRNYVKQQKLHCKLFPRQEDLIAFIERDILELSVVTDAFNDDKIEEIQINDFNDLRFIIGGTEIRSDLTFRNPDHLNLFVTRLVRRSVEMGAKAKNLSDNIPFIRFRYNDTTRISAMSSPVTHRSANTFLGTTPMLAIRKQKDTPFDSSFILKKGSASVFEDRLIEDFTVYKQSICFFGGTNTGKTAMLRRYLTQIPNNRRVITIAEVDEMNLQRVDRKEFFTHEDDPSIPENEKRPNPNYLRPINSVLMWECPDQNMDIFNGLKGFPGLINAALTFSPDTIVLQESKGGEIKDVINAAVSGHQVFTTIHATDPDVFFLRILLMYQEAGTNISDSLIMKQVPKAFPIIVNAKRMVDGSRKLTDVTELVGYNAVTQEPIFNPIVHFIASHMGEDENGKPKLFGDYYTNKEGFLSEKLKANLIENGISEKELSALDELYSETKHFSYNRETGLYSVA